MKKVLVIANLYHASPRIPSLAAYLPEYGWTAYIVTPPGPQNNAEFKIVEAPYRGDVFWPVRAFLKFFGFKKTGGLTEELKERLGVPSIIDRLSIIYQAIFSYPDTERTWIKPALNAARAALKNQRFDALLSSSPYPASHIVAHKLKREFNLPWVADFRDPWSQNHNYSYGRIRKWLDTRLEKKVIKDADAIIAASPGYAKKQEALHRRPVMVITNGFLAPETRNNLAVHLTKNFTITYTGAIYHSRQDPEKFLSALSELIKEKVVRMDELEVRFYGPKLRWLQDVIAAYDLSSVVKQYGVIPQKEAVLKQRESQLLLLFGWEDEKETGVYPQKTFEYLAAQRPILISGGTPQEDVKRVVSETVSGTSAGTREEIKSALGRFYREYRERGDVPFRAHLDKIGQYNYRVLAGRLATVINRLKSPTSLSVRGQ